MAPPPSRREPVAPKAGWGVLHLFARTEREPDVALLRKAVGAATADGYQIVPVAVLGHKADLCLMVIGPDQWRLRSFQSEVHEAGLSVCGSYVSVTEVSEYAAEVPEDLRQARLYPRLPPEGMPAFCFYPMSKRRQVGQNWYTLGFERRKELMVSHGSVGRRFRGRVLQLVTGSVGLDDWEWGVTLFGTAPDDLKECVYEMRFDEASALFAEFGPFYTGVVGELEEVLDAVSAT